MEKMDGETSLAEAFDQAAPRYDLLTGLNPGYHRHLDAAARDLVGRLGGDAGLLLDLGCGSGSSTVALLRHAPAAKVIGIDASAGMLEQARAKPWPSSVEFHHLPAERLAELELPPADGALAAYLLRNLDAIDRDATLAAILDRLRPGGWLVIQEYSVARRRWAELVWTLVCWLVVIPLSWLVRGSPRLYRYLWRSVRQFDSTTEVVARLERVGFTAIEQLAVTGWQRGILHIFAAQRPHPPTANR
ncbi:MAG: class I SAM-dependent methyltransferase [Propionibacteriaceae bacterium]|nr:class I SAM-dependent methyltransferase [Propionibacteriaceae bacterium]